MLCKHFLERLRRHCEMCDANIIGHEFNAVLECKNIESCCNTKINTCIQTIIRLLKMSLLRKTAVRLGSLLDNVL